MKENVKQNKLKNIGLSIGIGLIITGIVLLITITYLQSQNNGSLPHDNSINWLYHSNDKNIKQVPNMSKPTVSYPVIGYREYDRRRLMK